MFVEAQALLRRVQDQLRTDLSVNVFLTIDIDTDPDDIYIVTRSIEYLGCSIASASALPFLGHNFGVGKEAESFPERLWETHGDRMLFVHEADVTIAMIRSASIRWDLRVKTYETEPELVSKLRRLAGGINSANATVISIGSIDY